MDAPRLLLVEDEIALREELTEFLGHNGFDVTEVGSGTQAIAELEGGAAQFRAMVTDVNLGSGPDGWAVGRRAREFASGIPVVYITGGSLHDWSSMGVPESVLLAKPFASLQLSTAVSMRITAADKGRPGRAAAAG